MLGEHRRPGQEPRWDGWGLLEGWGASALRAGLPDTSPPRVLGCFLLLCSRSSELRVLVQEGARGLCGPRAHGEELAWARSRCSRGVPCCVPPPRDAGMKLSPVLGSPILPFSVSPGPHHDLHPPGHRSQPRGPCCPRRLGDLAKYFLTFLTQLRGPCPALVSPESPMVLLGHLL